jgi:hypothetical protein
MTRAHWGVTALLAVIVGWFVFDGVSSLIGLPALYEQLSSQLGLESAPVPWVALWAGVVLPVVFFVVAVVIARRESITRFTLVLIVALAATAAVRLSLIAAATGSIIFVN